MPNTHKQPHPGHEPQHCQKRQSNQGFRTFAKENTLEKEAKGALLPSALPMAMLHPSHEPTTLPDAPVLSGLFRTFGKGQDSHFLVNAFDCPAASVQHAIIRSCRRCDIHSDFSRDPDLHWPAAEYHISMQIRGGINKKSSGRQPIASLWHASP
jgi:hypothetical protein